MSLIYCERTRRHYEVSPAGEWRHVYPSVTRAFNDEGLLVHRVSWLAFSDWGSPASFVEAES